MRLMRACCGRRCRRGKRRTRIVIDMQEELQSLCGKPKVILDEPEDNSALRGAIDSLVGERLLEAAAGLGRHERNETTAALLSETQSSLSGDYERHDIEHVFEEAFTDAVRASILSGKRPDGRTHSQIRPLTSRVGVLPRAHGSALFQRGETQVLNVTTLGPLADAQKLDSLTPIDTKRYFAPLQLPALFRWRGTTGWNARGAERSGTARWQNGPSCLLSPARWSSRIHFALFLMCSDPMAARRWQASVPARCH